MGKQLSLFGIENKNERPSGYDYDYTALSRREPETNKAPRFISLSVLIHGALVMGALSITPLIIKAPEPETITIELEDLEAPTLSQGQPVMASQAAQEPTPTEPIAETKPTAMETKTADSLQITQQSSPVEVPKTPLTPKAAPTPQVAKSAAPAKVTKASTPTPVATPPPAAPQSAPVATLDDIDAPELENLPQEQASSITPVAPVIEKVEAKQARLEDIDEGFDSSLDTNELEKAQAQEQQALLQEQEKVRQKNMAAIAAAKQAEAEELKRRQALADQQRAGEGSGNNGNPHLNTPVAGAPQGVRSLDQLKQMPRNPLPQYSADERFHGHQGVVVFQAYITPAGKPTQFKMVQSSGHQNLDSKTLAALQNWKFYPGQEGWVELPFKWSLSGEAQETGRLRRASLESAD